MGRENDSKDHAKEMGLDEMMSVFQEMLAKGGKEAQVAQQMIDAWSKTRAEKEQETPAPSPADLRREADERVVKADKERVATDYEIASKCSEAIKENKPEAAAVLLKNIIGNQDFATTSELADFLKTTPVFNPRGLVGMTLEGVMDGQQGPQAAFTSEKRDVVVSVILRGEKKQVRLLATAFITPSGGTAAKLDGIRLITRPGETKPTT